MHGIERFLIAPSRYIHIGLPCCEAVHHPLHFGNMLWVPGDVETVKLKKPFNIKFINARNRRRNLRKKTK